VYKGVFDRDGDTLKICYTTNTAAVRPAECKADESNVLYVFKRVTPSDK
jgi:hypothetical protein